MWLEDVPIIQCSVALDSEHHRDGSTFFAFNYAVLRSDAFRAISEPLPEAKGLKPGFFLPTPGGGSTQAIWVPACLPTQALTPPPPGGSVF